MARTTASYVVPGWATSVNFPVSADPWSGTPTKVAPPSAATGFVPGQAAAAEYVNYEISQAFATDTLAKAAINTLADNVGQGEALTFKTAPFTTTFKVAFDQVSNRWAASASTGGGDLPWLSYDGGATWISGTWPSAPSTKPILTSNPAGLIVGIDGFSNKGFSLPAGSPTWSNWTLGGLSTNSQFREATWLASGNVFIAVAKHTVNPTMIKGTGVANWTDATASIPAPLATAGAGVDWTCAASPTRFIAIPRTAGVNYMTSDDGVTFTLRTTLPNAANFAGRAVHYNSVEGLWMYVSLFTNFSANQITVYTSPDGLTWTQKSAPGSLNWEVYDLTSAGGVWAMLVQRDSGIANMTRTTVLYSVDSGVSWHLTDASANPFPAGGSDPPRNQIVSDGYRLMWNTAENLYVGQHSSGLRTAIA